MDWDYYLPLIFLVLLGLALTAYVLLDGFDLGVGMLLPRAKDEDQDLMVDSIGPFWDANETWIVLGVGVIFIAFPKANSLIFGELYLPTCLMLICLMVRGAAYEFRKKACNRRFWNYGFVTGSFGMALAQGYMLGRYITAFSHSTFDYVFSIGVMLTVPAVYVLLASCWLIAKAEGSLRDKAIDWANQAWWPVCICLVLISIMTPMVSALIYDRWFEDYTYYLLPIPLLTGLFLIQIKWFLLKEEFSHKKTWLPFILTVGCFLLCALGLGISIFPYIVIDQLSVWEAAASTPSLLFTLIGVCLTIPLIFGYFIFSYWVFRGKAEKLNYL